ncbi:hypothetical protein EF847_15210 [Actinobacteria bacterium YIM 96077]|uniref:Uncharacterized protein n=1 Tax=Phytoactinopolyspora halophila TaxID=1981511 RepID=A0A329QTR3_9ACTN|nr:hypothetical protein EF847_15210 [Actinobacteria bacterium YIM 96077]RAW15717.1 hypothetical protein DPM12_08130 [Phytoactinopolyspora halophila]
MGNAHILAAIANAGEPIVEGDALTYVGKDDRGVELTIIIVPDDRAGWMDSWTIIHAMPNYRR